MKHLVLAFDGTWNTPDEDDTDGDNTTNVYKFYDAVMPATADGVEQLRWYEEGVGTNWFSKLPGGMFGVGLTHKIQQGYQWLAERYESGDKVFIVGFSRGAYTARSLVGKIRNSGLLKPEHLDLVKEAYQLYRARDDGADSDQATLFRQEYSLVIDIHFLGVWDTVGSLGIPIESFDWFNKAYYQFHDTELSGIVKNAFHAVAIDEHRKNYDCTLWNPRTKPGQRLEQVWFSGAHANVGGGYANNTLSDVSLKWMMERAIECGLELDPVQIPVPSEDDLPEIVDSYKRFLRGAYSRLEPRHFRSIGATLYGSEAIDPSVPNRSDKDTAYRPRNQLGGYVSGELRRIVDGPQPA